jgi:hypothetical protein
MEEDAAASRVQAEKMRVRIQRVFSAPGDREHPERRSCQWRAGAISQKRQARHQAAASDWQALALRPCQSLRESREGNHATAHRAWRPPYTGKRADWQHHWPTPIFISIVNGKQGSQRRERRSALTTKEKKIVAANRSSQRNIAKSQHAQNTLASQGQGANALF